MKRRKSTYGDVRRILIFLVGYLFLFTVSCRQSPVSKWNPDPLAELNVYFFHLNDRCEACTAIEINTKSVLDENFKTMIGNGEITFHSFNINKKENKAVTEKYQVSYTSLLLVRSDGTITDFTSTALNYAHTSPSKFMALLKAEIEKNLE